jgi:2,5-diketo-D-gluconate reductase A
MTASVPTLTLNDGNTIPQLGFGVFKVDPAQTERIVSDALEVGYRHIDTAAIYGNEEGVGKAIAASGIPRDELFITTKLYNNDQGTQSAFDAMALSLEKLGLEHVDLYLIHWPSPKQDRYVESWKALEQLKAQGKTRSIGVSNFLVHHLERVIAESGTVPAVDQVERHPWLQQPELTAYAQQHGIALESWGPLGQGKYPLLELPEVTAIASAKGATPAQVVIAWHLAVGNIVIPKSNSRERMAENFAAVDVRLAADEVEAINALERNERVGGHPDEVE